MPYFKLFVQVVVTCTEVSIFTGPSSQAPLCCWVLLVLTRETAEADPKNYLNLRSLAYQFSHNLEMHQQSGWTSLSNHHIFPLKHDDKDLMMKSEMSLCYWGLESLDLQRQERRP
jgi:hypothetical protein